ncbi:MAG TPA: cyclic-phosphate processing receiver domain-containing protein [Planctomycetota bacterium]|nr:cyclic-phosphate processing receiver domain-containing protein [Planctomycetota bacterium]
MSPIAILEDDPRRTEAFSNALRHFGPHFVCPTAPEFIRAIRDKLSTLRLISLDHDLLVPLVENPGTGLDVATFLSTQTPACPVIVHTTNRIGREGMLQRLKDSGWKVDWVPPFGDLDWIEKAWMPLVREMLGA